ncbi:MAG: translation initiation factor eIF-1A [Thermoprotei archaeon]|nr:MAG: translation initiation factor eIF-1A [Thermoprotei archaeon]RLF03287.1 MAG: translation initiation factor eIF-1A [Thermoprotei archaeon]
MPKKKRGGEEKREAPLPTGEDQVLGVIVQMLGYDRVKVRCSDGYTRLCRIPGKMKKRVWLRLGDIVLVGIWDFQPKERGDILYRYARDEVKELEKKGLLKWLEEEEEGGELFV